MATAAVPGAADVRGGRNCGVFHSQIRTLGTIQTTADRSADEVQNEEEELSTTRLVLILGGLWVSEHTSCSLDCRANTIFSLEC
jgi:hypothetical protein